MGKFIIVNGALLLGTLNAICQGANDQHQQTMPPVTARFEIVQSELSAKWTFRLDRFSGHVAQLVKNKNDDNAWQDMEVLGLPAASTHPHFQIFLSGLAARFTFLLDTETGITWQLLSFKAKGINGAETEDVHWIPLL